MKKLCSNLLVFVAIIGITFTTTIANAASTWNTDTDDEWNQGTGDVDIDTSSTPGDIKLQASDTEEEQTTIEDFSRGQRSDTQANTADDVELASALPATQTYDENGNDQPPTQTPGSAYIYGGPNFNINHSQVYNAPDGGNYLFIALAETGGKQNITVINTGTSIYPTTDDITECVYRLDGTATEFDKIPLIAASPVHIVIDTTNNLIYVGESGEGLQVLTLSDVNDPCSATEVGRYNEDNTAGDARVADSVVDFFLDETNDLIYITDRANALGAPVNGLSIIDRNDTPSDLSDDVSYRISSLGTELTNGGISSGSTPAATNLSGSPSISGSNATFDLLLDSDNDIVYSGGSLGLLAFERNGTPDDPTTYVKSLLTTGTSFGTGSIPDNRIGYLKKDGDVIYGGTISGISDDAIFRWDRNNTPTTYTDDTITLYDKNWHPNFSTNSGDNITYIDIAGGIVYAGTNTSIVVINPATNRLLYYFNTTTSPALDDATTRHVIYDSASNALMIGTYTEYSIISLDEVYESTGTFKSKPFALSGDDSKWIEWSETLNGNPNIGIETRTASGTLYWEDEFDDGFTTNVADDPDGSGPFNNTAESGGLLSQSDSTTCYQNFDGSDYCATEVSSGESFGLGSVANAKIRANSDSDGYIQVYMTFDNFDSHLVDEWQIGPSFSNDWHYVSAVNGGGGTIGSVKFGLTFRGGAPGVGAEFDVDWLSITEGVDANWSGWSSETNGATVTSTITGQDWIQYRASLSTGDITTSPALNSLRISEGFAPTATYESEVFDSGGAGTAYTDLTAADTVPTGTSITYSTRTGDTAVPDGSWSSWEEVNSPIASPNGQYAQFQVILATTQQYETPSVQSVAITYEPAGGGEPSPTPTPTPTTTPSPTPTSTASPTPTPTGTLATTGAAIPYILFPVLTTSLIATGLFLRKTQKMKRRL